jgi:hypothetical protein
MVTDPNNTEPSSFGKLKNQSDDIELQNTAHLSARSEEQPSSTSSPYDIPREDRAGSAHTFTSDLDQQKIIHELKSEVAMLHEAFKSLSKRVEKLENK